MQWMNFMESEFMKSDMFVLIHLTMGMSPRSHHIPMAECFDRDVWNNIVKRCAERGYKGILLDVIKNESDHEQRNDERRYASQ